MGLNDHFAVLIFVLAGLACWQKSIPIKGSLKKNDKLVAGWQFLNGLVIHLLLDGMVGYCGAFPSLQASFFELDKRFIDGAAARTIALMELLFYTPLCLVTFYAICQRMWWRHLINIITCTVQITGTFVFLGEEIHRNFQDVPCDWNLEFTFNHVTKFWLGFVVANMVWIVCPLLCMKYSFDATRVVSGGATTSEYGRDDGSGRDKTR